MEIGADIPGQNRNSINDGSHPLFLQPFTSIGRTVIAWVGSLGAAAIFLVLALIRIPGRNQFSRIIQQTYYIGARSITIIMLVSLFTGMVLGLQSYHALVQFGAAGAVGSLVSLSLIMELGPVPPPFITRALPAPPTLGKLAFSPIGGRTDPRTSWRNAPVGIWSARE